MGDNSIEKETLEALKRFGVDTYRANFLTLMTYHFNIDELKDICFMLHIDYEEIETKTKSSMVREMILKLERLTQIAALKILVEHFRPEVNWDSPFEYEAEKGRVPAFDPVAVPILPLKDDLRLELGIGSEEWEKLYDMQLDYLDEIRNTQKP